MEDTINVLCYGDSNTWGYCPETKSRFSKHDRWTGRLQVLLGSKYFVIEEGLNARTTVFEDPVGPAYGSYSCHGRNYLMPCLHTHKPLDVVILALGVNDLKTHFSASPMLIRNGCAAMINDIRKAQNIGRDGSSPKIILCAPAYVKETETSREWGFVGAFERSKELEQLYRSMAESESVEFLAMEEVSSVSDVDGVHYPKSGQSKIARALCEMIKSLE